MSDTSEEKKHPPTPRKLNQARKKGQIPSSADFVRAASTCAGLGYLWFKASTIEDKCKEALLLTDKLQDMPFNSAVQQALVLFTELAVSIVGPFLGIIVAAAVLSGLLANRGLVFSFEPMMPKYEKIDPFKGLKRIGSMRSLSELVKTLVKVFVLSAVFLLVVLGMWKTMVYLPICGMGCVGFVFEEVKLLIGIAAGFFLIGGLIDLLVQRGLFLRDMRMTDTEMKRELKDQQGEPKLKRERHRLRNEMASERPLGVHRATLILRGRAVLVGLRYVRGETGVPVLVCRGEGEAVSQLFDEARALRLTIVHDDVLARQLISTMKMGDPVPKMYFEPVAKVLYAAGLV
ncbi:EscU/YscU/HrcU family type III secretion system export apparatus switch protein [Rhizobium leguminosarum]|uniref:EscU/YscU/HrcU family type III secretion system export apparatus switch protein n=1 Tax=Rhizobium leguminosarum TaxID=384 RepID=UPI00143F0F29|nr:EscU/YscU/HrcU family type III secretion system export apparatus switch protein [Rhizobium leguminosarum]NKL24838.1 EscU/YscU/HrcU family type III secretion system export apparatus switch protein [Rhizobium leguminosarum bv. viciae]NKL60070.1 EscU/YscU/HrcU family type III secretion system export apparatus switch protein [Rhizobium leguminosarum bv. viciae]